MQPPPHRPVTLRPQGGRGPDLGLRARMGRPPRMPTWPVRGNRKFQGDREAPGPLSLENRAQQPAVWGGHSADGAGGATSPAPWPWGAASSRAHSRALPPRPQALPRGGCMAPRLRQAAGGPGSGPSGPAERWAVGPQGLAEAGRSLPVPHPEQPLGAPCSSTGLRSPLAGAARLGSPPPPTPASREPRPNTSLRVHGRGGLGCPSAERHVPRRVLGTPAQVLLASQRQGALQAAGASPSGAGSSGLRPPHLSTRRCASHTDSQCPWAGSPRGSEPLGTACGVWGETTHPREAPRGGPGTASARRLRPTRRELEGRTECLAVQGRPGERRTQVASGAPPGLAPSPRHHEGHGVKVTSVHSQCLGVGVRPARGPPAAQRAASIITAPTWPRLSPALGRSSWRPLGRAPPHPLIVGPFL